MSNRKLWIDCLRGIAILFVLYGHLVQGWNDYFVFTSPIKIPLFFVITGYVFNHNRTNNKDFFVNLFIKLVVPWLLLSLLPELLLIPKNGVYSCITDVWGILLGKYFWYMPCCIIAEIIHFCILKLKNRNYIVVLSIMMAVFGYSTRNIAAFSYFMLNRAFFVQLFILVGYLLRDLKIDGNKKIIETVLYCGAGVYFLLGILTMIMYPGKSLDVHLFHYYNVLVCLLMIFLGCGILVELFKCRNVSNKVLSFIGQNTLVFYLLGGYAQGLCSKIFSRFFGLITPLSAIVVLLFMCAILSLASVIINHYFPFMVGKWKNS